jgi:hypothetical protein
MRLLTHVCLYVYISSWALIPDMSGLNKVFIFFVPIVGLCLIMSLFIKVCLTKWIELTGQDTPLEAPPAVLTASQVTESDDEKSRDEEQALDTCVQSHTSR